MYVRELENLCLKEVKIIIILCAKKTSQECCNERGEKKLQKCSRRIPNTPRK